MTEIGKFAPGLKGFPTPDTPADEDAYLLFLFPDKTWAQYILGACKDLVVEYNWYLAGELETWEASEALRVIIQEAPYNLVDRSVPAPYWDEDTADDADDTAPRDDQPWYGILIDDNLTWVENVGFWAITAFVAIAATPAAAIAFVPIARRFTVAVRQHNLGGIVKAFIDGAEVGSIDTYSPGEGVGELTVVMPAPGGAFRAEDTPHTLWVAMAEEFNPAIVGEPNIQVIRKRLTESDVSPSNLRWSSDCDCVEMTPDGGTTWNPAPGSDPRHAPAFRLPARTGVDRRCDAAASQVKWLRDFLDAVTSLLEAAGLAFQVANLLLDFVDLLFPGGILVELLVDIGAELFTIGGAALDAAFGDTEYDLLLCIFFCADDADGQLSADGFSSVQSQVTAQLNTTAGIVTNLILGAQGELGVSNAGVIGTETGDCSGCSGCGWCYRFNDTHQLDTWTSLPWNGCPGDSPATYGDGVWHSGLVVIDGCSGHNVTYTHLRIVLGATSFMTDGAVHGLGSLPANTTLWANGDGSLFSGTQIWNGGWLAGAGLDVDSLEILFFQVDSTTAFDIDWAQLSGTDDNPFGENNC